MARLVCLRGEHEGRTFPVDRGLTLGRAPHHGVPLPTTRGASRDHAKVWRTGERSYDLADLGSTNGTLVNDERRDRTALADGDSIQIGDAVFRFEWDEAEKPPAPAPRASGAGAAGGGARQEAAALFGAAPAPAASGEAPAAAAPGPPAMVVKERVLQYSKKAGGGTPLGWDLSQVGGLWKWVLVAAVAGAFALLFVLARGAGN